MWDSWLQGHLRMQGYEIHTSLFCKRGLSNLHADRTSRVSQAMSHPENGQWHVLVLEEHREGVWLRCVFKAWGLGLRVGGQGLGFGV